MASFTLSPMTQTPVFLQAPQAVQPETGPAPTSMSSDSMPSAAKTFSISRRARRELPSLCGLPLIMMTFIVHASLKPISMTTGLWSEYLKPRSWVWTLRTSTLGETMKPSRT